MSAAKGPVYTCPYAKTEPGTMLILCGAMQGANPPYCGHSAWRRCRGWSENTPDAADCPVRKEADGRGENADA